MAIPPTAKAFAQVADPADVLDWQFTLTQGAADASPTPLLQTGESVSSFTLTLPAESIAAGLLIKSGGDFPAPTLAGLLLTFWLAIDPTMQSSSIFNGAGVKLPLELTIKTSAGRIKQRTLTVTVANL